MGQKRLMGASLLVLSNKTDVSSHMSEDEIRKVDRPPSPIVQKLSTQALTCSEPGTGRHQDAQLGHHLVQCDVTGKYRERDRLDRTGCEGEAIPLLSRTNSVRNRDNIW